MIQEKTTTLENDKKPEEMWMTIIFGVLSVIVCIYIGLKFSWIIGVAVGCIEIIITVSHIHTYMFCYRHLL